MIIKTKKISYFILFFIIILKHNGFAQTENMHQALNPSISLLQYKGELGNKYFNFDTQSLGFALSYSRYLSKNFDFQGGIGYNKLNGLFDTDSLQYSMNGSIITPSIMIRYKFYNDYLLKSNSHFMPYISCGFEYWGGRTKGASMNYHGNNFVHRVDELAFLVNAGVKYRISERNAVFIEATNHFATTDELDGSSVDRKNDKYLTFALGISINLGKLSDDDGDGVPNNKDKCPDTPKGVKVDKDGCPTDRDGDGIIDNEDDCPDDPGLPQFNGCPDKDGDGIMDKEDECPDEPGLPEYNGCPDTDGDGVPDKKDLCPDTPKGMPVNENGCPMDTDGDGLTDDIDNCPDVPGPWEYMGCPEPEEVATDWKNQINDFPSAFFETAKFDLSEDAKSLLNDLAKKVLADPKLNVRIFGSADPRGTDEYNFKLSEKRVEAVVNYLLKRGVPKDRLKPKAMGEVQEIKKVNESIDETYRKARKVNFDFYYKFK